MVSRPNIQEINFVSPSLVKGFTRKLKVTYFLGSLRDGGTERQVLELMKHLDRARFSVSVILFRGDGMEKIPDDVQSRCVLNTAEESSQWLTSAGSKIKVLKNLYSYFTVHRPDVVHAFLPAASILGVLPARMAGVPAFIGSRRSLAPDYRRGRILAGMADSLALKLSHTNIGNSVAVTEAMVSGGCPQPRSLTIYNGVDTTRFHPSVIQTWRRAMGWDDFNIVFGIVANFYPYKRHIDFVKAATLVIQKYPQARFVMVGMDYGTQRNILDKINELGLSSKIRHIENVEHPEEIFAGIDVLISTSETEGFSNVLLEAMATGKPVIATDVGGNREIVLPDETGFLVPVSSPESIARACGEFIESPDLRYKLGTHGRKTVVENFSLETMIRSHEELYQHLLAKTSRKNS